MLVVRNIRVSTVDRDALTVTWEIAPTTEDTSTFTITVLRSMSAGGPYDPVSLPMVAADYFEFNDRGVNLLSKWREYYYRVRVTGGGEEREYGSTPYKKVLEGLDPGGVVMEYPPDLDALEAIRRFELVLTEYNGKEVLFYARRTWGQRCSVCWDVLKRRSSVSQCSSCFGTSFSSGYFSPQKTRCMKPPHQMLVALTPLFRMEPNDVIMWFNATPRVHPGDLVVAIDGSRYRVVKINRSEKGQSLTRQTVQMREISRDQIEHKVPVPEGSWNADTMTVGSIRQYVRASDIDSYFEAKQALGLSSGEDNEIEEFHADVEEALDA